VNVIIVLIVTVQCCDS